MTLSIDAYRTANLETASPLAVIIKALAAADKFLAEAQEALAEDRPADEPLTKARTIVGGLMTSLDFEAGDLSKQLLQLYLFVLDRVQSTMADRKDAGLDDARSVLSTLRSAWEEMPAEDVRRGMSAKPPVGLRLKG